MLSFCSTVFLCLDNHVGEIVLVLYLLLILKSIQGTTSFGRKNVPFILLFSFL